MGVINFIGNGANIAGSLSGTSVVQDMPSAYSFGTADENYAGSFVDCGDRAEFEFPAGEGHILSAWVKMAKFSDHQFIAGKSNWAGTSHSEYFIGMNNDGRFHWVCNNGSGGDTCQSNDVFNNTIDKEGWNHIMGVRDTSNNMTLYINGVAQTDTGTCTGDVGVSSQDFGIGTRNNGGTPDFSGDYWRGNIRDVRIYSGTATDTELQDIFADTNADGVTLAGGSLVGWWKMGGDFNDSSGNGFTGVLTTGSDSTDYWDMTAFNLYQFSEGLVSGSILHVSGGTLNLRDKTTYLDFNGTNAYCNVPSAASLDEPKTIAFWCKPDGIQSGANNVVSRGSNDYEIYFHNSTNTWWNYWGTKYSTGADGPTVSVGQWQHIVCTLDDSTSPPTVRWYKDGELYNTDPLSGTPVYGDDGVLNIGRDASEENDYFDGAIKDVLLYSTKLTDAQAKLLFQGQWVGTPTHYWKLNEGTGNGADSGVNSSTAQTQNTTWVKPKCSFVCSADGGTNKFDILSGAAISAPEGELELRGLTDTAGAPRFRITGTYTHNNGTLLLNSADNVDWYPANLTSKAPTTFYKVKTSGTKPTWKGGSWTIEHSLNLAGNMRANAHSGGSTGHILTIGTTGSVGYISGSNYIQAMTNSNGGSLIKSASENYPAILSGTSTDYGCTIAPYRSIQVSGVHMFGSMKTGNNAFDNTSVFKILGNTVWGDRGGGGAEIKFPLTDASSNDTGQTLDVSGASVHIKIPMYISGNMIAKDAALFINKFGQTLNREIIHNDNTKIIYSHQTANNDTFIMPAISGQQMMNSNYRQFTNAEYDIKGDLIVGRTNTTGFRLNHNFSCKNIYVGDDANAVFDQNDKTLTVSGTKLSAVGGFIGACQGMFDNTASQRITISDNLDEMATSNNFTVEAWFEASDDANYRGIFSRGSSWGTGNIYMYQNSDGYVQVSAHDLGTTLTSQTIGLADGKWHHAAATYDQTSFKLYIDGILEAESAHTNAINTQTGGSFIGSRGTSDYFNGSLVRVSAWDTALTQSQIQQMMFMDYLSVSSSAIDHTKCVSWFQFDGKTNNTTVYNLAANGTDGTAATTALWDVPNGYSNWIKGTGSSAQLYLTSPLDIDVWGKNWRIGAISGGATAGKKMKITRWDGYEQTIQFYGAWKWGPGTIEQRNYATYGDNATPWCTAQAGGYVEEMSGTPFGDASNGLSSYWQSSTPTKPMTIKNMLPTDNVNLGADVTVVGTMMPSLSSKSKYIDTHGWDMNLKQWKSYGGTVAELRLRGGSTLYFVNDNTGFSEGVSNNSLLQIVASGENAASFNQFSDKNNYPSNYNYIDTNATIAGTGSPAAFTVSFWYKSPTDLASYTRTYTTAIGFNGGSDGGISLIGSNWLVLCEGNNYRYFNSAPNADGLWHHMLVYVDPADATNTRMWIDGSEESAGSTTNTGTVNWSGDVYFGYGDYGAMPVSLADIRFYNAANTPTGSVATLAAINPATSETLSYADPSNTLNAYAWFKLDSNDLGVLSIADTIGTYNSAALAKAGSAPDPKSCYVKILPSGTTNAWQFNVGTGDKMLQNFYLSGTADDYVMVGASGTANADGTYYPGGLITKGRVRFD